VKEQNNAQNVEAARVFSTCAWQCAHIDAEETKKEMLKQQTLRAINESARSAGDPG
jgi:hypothetical protein